MKKRERLRKKENVIFLPDMDKRLMEKGLDSLQLKQYREAIEFFSEALQLDPDNHDVYIGLVLAYFELGNLPEAKQLAKEMLKTGIGDYFQVVDLYIMILVQQHQFEEIISTIEALLEEKEVPSDKLEHFTRMLHFSQKMLLEKIEKREDIPEEPEEHADMNLFSLKDPKEQVHIAAQLANQNVRSYIKEIASYLSAQDAQPFFKTMLLNVLKEQEYEKPIIVSKFGINQEIVPNELFELHQHPDYSPIYELISGELENENPVLLENIKVFMDRYFFLLYPFRIESLGGPNNWAAAFHYICLSYLGLDETLSEIAEKYSANEMEVSSAVTLIGQIEEFSSP